MPVLLPKIHQLPAPAFCLDPFLKFNVVMIQEISLCLIANRDVTFKKPADQRRWDWIFLDGIQEFGFENLKISY